MVITDCIFCRLDQKLIIKSTPTFYLVADPYPLVSGHIMIVSKQHHSCCGALDARTFAELNHLRRRVEEKYESNAGQFLSYEHGRAGSCTSVKNNYECHHMHLHFLPISIELHALIDKKIKGHSIDFSNLPDLYNSYGDYLLVGDSSSGHHFFNVDSIDTELPPHYLRSIIASTIGCNERANWESLPASDLAKLNIKSIKNDIF